MSGVNSWTDVFFSTSGGAGVGYGLNGSQEDNLRKKTQEETLCANSAWYAAQAQGYAHSLQASSGMI